MQPRSDRERGGSDPAHQPDPGQLDVLLANGKRHSRRRRIILLVVGLLLVGGAGLLYLLLFRANAATGAQSYETAPITRGDLKSSITSTGTVEALNNVQVGAEISGRIASIKVDFNDSVEQGQLLAEIDPEQLEAAAAQAQAQVVAARAGVVEARAALVEARLNSERSTALAEKGLLSSKELETATATAKRAAASVQSAQASAAIAAASYDAARSKLGKTEIRAPISGTVLSREVESGQTINAGMQTPVLFVIAEDLRRMRLSSLVDEADVGTVAVGQAASFTVDAYPDHTFASEVLSVHNVPQVTQNVVSYEVLLSVDNKDLLLKPGMTATVEIVTALQRNVLLVPNKALRFAPPTPSREAMRPPPGLPFLGKSGGKSGGAKKTGALDGLGKLGSRQAVLWILDGLTPKPFKVDKLATDGVQTGVEGDGLAERMQVILDLAAAKKE
ncbi:MAG: efflux RND transporter periplasmic adaptor subunit [Deltaproteobacteria bacterium]|nr:efflux RND transporter periplasmic adaptor subunit [Deltaproteobacteria bacterium]